jgi:hypothetical protein
MADRDMMVKMMPNGWLLVQMDSGAKQSLPEYCHVKLRSTANGRDSITIQEGPLKGKTATVTSGYLVALKQETSAAVRFFVGSGRITWDGGPEVSITPEGGVTGGVLCFTDKHNKVPPGTWDLEMPDAPHAGGQHYTQHAPHATCWFRIASPDANDRYLHPGTVSVGCATCGIESDRTSPEGQKALKAYEMLYAYLINRRKKPGIVGQMSVHDY